MHEQESVPSQLRCIYLGVCDRLKRQSSVSSHQAVIDGGGECVSHVGLNIAISSYIHITVLFTLLITTFTCRDFRENLVDLPGSLILRDPNLQI